MEALGSYLKDVRENANLSIDKVVDETHIVRKFIEAIEKDEFSMFPGEAYLKGFLRTYSEYLGLDPDDVVKRYEKIKIAEEPTPIEQLIPKPKFDFRPLILISTTVILSAAIIIGIIFFIVKISGNINNNGNIAELDRKKNDKKKKSDKDPTVYKMIENEKKFDLKKGDLVEFNVGQNKESITVKELSPTVVINDSEGREYILIKSYPQKVDLNNDQNNEFQVTLDYWDDKMASLSIKLFGEGGQSSSSEITSSVTNLQGDNIEKIATEAAQTDIQADLNFQDECFMRYQIDNSPYVESYNKSGKSVSLKAKSSIMLWFSNAGAAKINFSNYNKSYNAGESGKIEVKLIKWVLNNSGQNELQISSLK
jgi:cytoskeleton protein RodZ